MAAVTSTTGVFSGLDTSSIISRLMAVEAQPLQTYAAKKKGYQAELSVFGKLKSSLTSLSSAAEDLKNLTTQAMSASSSDTSIFTATADSTAAAGTYNLLVSQLATAQSVYSASFASESSEVADLTTYATQKLKIWVGSGTAHEITVDSDNNTLSGIRDAINDAGAGVNASIINAGFEITASNNTIAFNDGSNRTATLSAGTYSSDTLAAEIKRAMEAANGGTDTYTVSYDATSHKFSVANDGTNTNAIDILWEDAGTTAAGVLGFTATDHASIAVGGSSTGDIGVGGYHLVLNAAETGAASHIKILVDEDNDGTYAEAGSETDATGLSQLAFDAIYDSSGNVSGGTANLTQTAKASSASLTVNGLSVSRDANTISDLITGVTLNLLDTSATTETLTISNDTQAVIDKVNSFVSSYNGTMTLIKSVVSSSATNRALLSGDSSVNGILSTLRNTISTVFGSYAPATLGITHSKEGVLQVDSGVLQNYLDVDLSGVIDSFNKMGASFDDNASFFANTSIPARTDGLNRSIERVDTAVADLQRRLALTQVQLTKRFNNLETLIGQLQQSSNSLTQMIQGLGSTGN